MDYQYHVRVVKTITMFKVTTVINQGLLTGNRANFLLTVLLPFSGQEEWDEWQ
jgi:hypothetical protein